MEFDVFWTVLPHQNIFYGYKKLLKRRIPFDR
jgi:hypothetical protein